MWHEVIKALSRLVFWKYKLRGKLLLKIKLSYCSCPLRPWAGPSGHLGPLERYKRFMQSSRARYREYRSKSWRDRVIKSDLTNHVPFFLSCDWPIKMRHDIWHMLQVLFFLKFSQNSIDLKIKKISPFYNRDKFQNWIWTRCDKVRVTWPHESSHVSVTFR